jgi:hypothetical protein
MEFRPVARVGSVLAMVALGATVAGCSASATQPYAAHQVNPLAGDLQVAVGTANIYGDELGSSNIGTNVVETFRQVAGGTHPGDTDAFVTTPSLAGPFTLPATAGTADGFGATIETGPGPTEVSTGVMTGTAQPNPGDQTIAPSTFGVSTNASGFGLEPFNFTSVNGNNGGTPDSYVPYTQPLYDPGSPAGADTDADAFVPWGGPPAYDPDKDGLGTRDGEQFPPGVVGVSLGLDVFENVAPKVGTYTFSVVVPTSSTTNGTKSVSATLPSTTILPAIAPAAITLDANGDGGGTVTATLPTGVTEALVQILDIGPDDAAEGSANCNNALASPVYYTFEFTASGTQTIPAAIGPGTKTAGGSPTICSAAANTAANGGTATNGDTFFVQTIGYDYPAYEISYPNSSGNPAPTLLTGAQADITISSADICDQDDGLECPSVDDDGAVKHRALAARLKTYYKMKASGFHVMMTRSR